MKLSIKVLLLLLSLKLFSQNIEVKKHEINFREGSKPYYFKKNDSHFFFTANDGVYGRELWKSDGTIEGTQLVKDINTNKNITGGDSSPSNFLILNNVLYFTAFDENNGFELWRSDGTENGTYLLKNINESTRWNLTTAPNNLYAFKNNIYFNAYSEQFGWELWRSDGTKQGTLMLKDLNEFGDGNPQHFIEFNSNLYFSANDGSHGVELWKTDGTENGTIMVKDINSGSNNSIQGELFVSGKYIYFGANNDNFGTSLEYFGTELWRSDGTSEGTVLVKDIYSGYGNGINNLKAIDLNGILIFEAYTPELGKEIWRSDGTENGTSLIKDIDSIVFSSLIHNIGFFKFKNEIYFIADDNVNGIEVWKTDGTNPGTIMLKDINIVGESGNVNVLNLFVDENNEKLLFYAREENQGNLNLWVSDGTSNGTEKIDAIVQPDDYYVYDLFIEFKNKIFISGRNSKHRSELFSLDPINLNINLFKDLNFKADGNPSKLIDLNGNLLFRAIDGVSDGYQLYKSNTSTNEIELVKRGVNIDDKSFMIVNNNQIFFSAHNGSDGFEPWTSDGTESGTYMLKDIRPNGSSLWYLNDVQKFYSSNNLVYFFANDGSHGFEPWRSDGTKEGTFMLKDINTEGNGTGHNQEGGSSWPKDFIEFNGLTYFISFDSNGPAVWVTNGTTEGTEKIFSHLKLGRLHKMNNKLILSGIEEGFFWESDGTETGTKRISLPSYMTIGDNKITLNNELYFVTRLENIINRFGLYKTDGTIENTTLLYEGLNHPNMDYIVIKNLTKCGGYIYFELEDYYGRGTAELWRTNGNLTEQVDSDTGIYEIYLTCHKENLFYNTDNSYQLKLIQENSKNIDILNLKLQNNEFFSEYSITQNLISSGDYLFFPNRTDDSGLELFSLKIDNMVLSTRESGELNLAQENLKLFPNPASNEINIRSDHSFNGYLLYDVNGKLIKRKYFDKTKTYKFNLNKIQNGFYFLQILSGEKRIIQKVIINN